MAKKIKLTFAAEGAGTMNVSIADPKEGMTLAEAKTQAASIIPVLISSDGNAATELKSAVIISTEETALE